MCISTDYNGEMSEPVHKQTLKYSEQALRYTELVFITQSTRSPMQMH